ncbi:MAG: hypothetical protein WD009_06940 [Phycisphaeraceae bacterium]
MINWLFGIDAQITAWEWALRRGWPGWVMLLLVVAAIAYAVWLYRSPATLAPPRRVVLASLRGGALVLLLFVLFEPVLRVEYAETIRPNVPVLIDVSESMSVRDMESEAARGGGAVRDWALARGLASFDDSDTVPVGAAQQVAGLSRLDLARGLLAHDELELLARLRAQDQRAYPFHVGASLESLPTEAGELADALAGLEADAPVTRLGSLLAEAADRFSGQLVGGIVLLTDGGSNDGLDPLEAAERLGEQGIPIYAVGLGLPDPPDVAVRSLAVQETVFVGDRVPVRFQLDSTGYAGQTAAVRLELDGRVVDEARVTLTGEAQVAELAFEPERPAEAADLAVTIAAMGGESNEANNRVVETLRIIDEQIRVLYIEGQPRWEFRYLSAVLQRDHRLDVRFLMTQGDRELAAASDRYLDSYPEQAGEAFAYDLVILGDVPASFFSTRQLERMVELVRERGGALLMLAGRDHAPATYLNTPIASVLPVHIGDTGFERVGQYVHPVVTAAGRRSEMVMLERPDDRSDELWELVQPLPGVPGVAGAKPGASVLLELSDTRQRREAYPLLAWHRYGSGRAMYIGTDQLWRLRFMRGDRYHARFWGQAIQFLTLSRLLGEAERVQIETPRSSYRTGEQVEVFANVMDESFEPVRAGHYAVTVESVADGAVLRTLELAGQDETPGVYRGSFRIEQAGRFAVRAERGDRDAASEPVFDVEAVSLEWVDTALKRDILEQMAERSGGRYFEMAELPELVATIVGERRERTIVRREQELFDLPWMLLLLVGMVGTEWYLRRRFNLT